MTTSGALDAPFLDLTDSSLARPTQDVLSAARAGILRFAAELLALPDSALPKPWGWHGASDEEVRYAAYRAFEALELAEVDARTLISTGEVTETRAALVIAPATAARWDLHGLLVGLSDGELDADPGGGEWTIRRTLAHVISGQRSYAWGTAWWQATPHATDDPALPARAPESFWEALPDEALEAEGTNDDVRARLDAIVDLAAERLAGIPDERLAYGARWSGVPVTVGFRIGRWSSHIREHTLQVEKTLAMVGHAPTETQRLARLVVAQYGRAEEVVFGRRATPERGAAVRLIGAAVTEAVAAIGQAAHAAAAAPVR
jgi:hypothetical protein